jgi:hypothetical protein
MPDIRKHGSVTDTIAAKTVSNEASWLVFQSMQQAIEETLGGCAVAPTLHQDVEHDPVLIHRAPQIVQHAATRMNTSSRCQVSPGCGRRLRSLLANSAPSFRHQCRMLSWVTTMPRSASSTSRKLRLNK